MTLLLLQACKFAVVPAAAGATCGSATTRINLINTAGYSSFIFSVDGHTLRVVAVDALPTIATKTVPAVSMSTGTCARTLACVNACTYAFSGSGSFGHRGDWHISNVQGEHSQ